MPPSKRETNLAAFVETLMARFDRRILDFDTAALRRWGVTIAELEARCRSLIPYGRNRPVPRLHK